MVMTESPNRPHPPHVLAVLSTYSTSAEIFILRPFGALHQAQKVVFEVTLENQLTRSKLLWADIVILCRNNLREARRWHEEMLALSKPYIYILDDNFWALPDHLADAAYYKTGGKLQQMEEYVRFANLVKVFSPELARRVRRYTARVVCDTAALDFSLLPRVLPPRAGDIIQIAYVTARGARDELVALFEQDLLAILAEFPQKVQAVFFTERPPAFQEVPNVQVVAVDWQYDRFIRSLAQARYDIGLAPLLNTEFYLSKTNTKTRDYGACRIAGIYSNLEPYFDIVPGVTGLRVDQKPGAWYDAMRTLILDDRLRQAIQEQAYQYVYQTYRLEIAEQQWLDEISQLVPPEHPGRVYPAARAEDGPTVQLSIGSPQAPSPDFVNADNHFRAGVQLVMDWNQPFPLAADGVEVCFLDHVLEKSRDPQAVIAEANRVVHHGAQISVFSTYAPVPASVRARALNDEETAGGVGTDGGSVGEDPISGIGVNEQTARDWTNAPLAAVYPDEYDPSALEQPSPWGRGRCPELDIRCAGMKFIYIPAIAGRMNYEKRQASREHPEVCSDILLQLSAIKGPAPEIQPVWEDRTIFEPDAIGRYRLQELCAIYQQESAQRERIIRDMETRIQEQNQNINRLKADIHQMQKAAAAQGEQLADVQQKLAVTQWHANRAAAELDQYRSRKIIKVIERLFDRSNLYAVLEKAYHPMLDDSLMFNQNLSGYHLQVSANLQPVPCREYTLNWVVPRRVTSVVIAPVIDAPLTQGGIGVELVAGGRIIGQQIRPADSIIEREPFKITFDPAVDIPAGALMVRVFVRDLNAPLRIMEWRRYQRMGLKLQRKVFCGFDFEE